MEGNGQWRFTPPVHCILAFDQALTWLATMELNGDVKDAVRDAHGDDWLELVAIPSSSIGWAIEEKA